MCLICRCVLSADIYGNRNMRVASPLHLMLRFLVHNVCISFPVMSIRIVVEHSRGTARGFGGSRGGPKTKARDK